jgi:hypothetical protein
VEVMKWVGDLDHFSELKEVWITLEGIPPRWCDCKVFAQMASSFGMLLDVDWSSLFKSYERVRVRVACRNPRKIPPERLFEMDKKLYLISIHVEGYEQEESDKTDMDDDDDMDDFGNDDHQEGGDNDTAGQNQMETEAADEHRRDAPTGQGGSSGQKGAKTVAISMEAKSVRGSVKKGLDQGVFGFEEMEILSGSQGEGQNQGDDVCEVLDL